MSERYANVEQIIKHIDNDGLLVGNNAEWAKEAVYNSDYIDIDYFVPASRIDQVKRDCDRKIEYYRSLGSISKVEAYCDFKTMLDSLWHDEEEW